MFIEVGTRVPIELLLQGMIVQSGNDASVALAEQVAGSEEAFADLIALARKLEPKIHPVYDVYVMIDSITNATNWPKEVFLDGPP